MNHTFSKIKAGDKVGVAGFGGLGMMAVKYAVKMENNIDSKSLAIEIAKILDQKKAQDVRVLKVESLTVLTDYFASHLGNDATKLTKRIGNAKEKNNFLRFKTQKKAFRHLKY